MSMPGAPQNDQRDAITMALMGIANPAGKRPLPQMPQQPPQGMPTNLSGGMTAIGNAIGGMGQPPPPGPPMSLAPPAPGTGMAQQPPPMPPPQAAPPPPQGAPVGAGGPPPQMPPQMPPGTGGLY